MNQTGGALLSLFGEGLDLVTTESPKKDAGMTAMRERLNFLV
jgi:hypothetical protein